MRQAWYAQLTGLAKEAAGHALKGQVRESERSQGGSAGVIAYQTSSVRSIARSAEGVLANLTHAWSQFALCYDMYVHTGAQCLGGGPRHRHLRGGLLLVRACVGLCCVVLCCVGQHCRLTDSLCVHHCLHKGPAFKASLCVQPTPHTSHRGIELRFQRVPGVVATGTGYTQVGGLLFITHV